MLLYQILAFNIQGIYKMSNKNYKCKISARAWIEEFELSDGSNSVSDIQDYLYLKKHEAVTDNLSIMIHVKV